MKTITATLEKIRTAIDYAELYHQDQYYRIARLGLNELATLISQHEDERDEQEAATLRSLEHSTIAE